MPSARSTSPLDGCCSSAPPGSRTSGGSAPSGGAVSCQVKGSRLARTKSSICIVVSDERGPDDLEADPLHALERLPAGDERGENQVAERAIVEQHSSQRVAVD